MYPFEFAIVWSGIVASLGLTGCSWYFFKDDKAGKLSMLASGALLGMSFLLFIMAMATK